MKMRIPAEWSDAEVEAEVRDMTEHVPHLEHLERATRIRLAAQLRATREAYGAAEARWPASSSVTVSRLRDEVMKAKVALASGAEYLEALTAEMARRRNT